MSQSVVSTFIFAPFFNITLSALIKIVALSWIMIWETVAEKIAPTRKVLLMKGYKSFL